MLAALRRSSSQEDQAALDEWRATQQLVVNLFGRPRSREEREGLEQRLQEHEERLARRSSAIRERRELAEVDTLLPRVSSRLTPDTALVEFVRFRVRASSPGQTDTWRYASFVLHHDGRHAAVDLGDASPIDVAARTLAEATAHPGASGDIRLVDRAAEALARLLAPALQCAGPEVRRLVLAPDGLLHLTPLHLLRLDGRYLADRYTISFVTSGRDLLRVREVSAATPPSALVAVTHYPVAAWNRAGFTVQAEAAPSQLPNVQSLVGPHATERAFRALQGPPLLHVAAHGLFAPEPGGGDPRRLAMRQGRLLFADVLPDLTSPPEGDDGQVMASEVLTMNLRGTRLVILAACDTARGEAPSGEGVFGLRRAFLLAGAEALVSTLWSVDDVLTVRFVATLYRRLRAGLRTADALREAAAAVRAVDPHPWAWAPFVLVGRDDVLDLFSPPRRSLP